VDSIRPEAMAVFAPASYKPNFKVLEPALKTTTLIASAVGEREQKVPLPQEARNKRPGGCRRCPKTRRRQDCRGCPRGAAPWPARLQFHDARAAMGSPSAK